MNEYREWAPPRDLAHMIQCVWALWGDDGGAGDAQPIIPDGCPEVILNLSDPFIRSCADEGEIVQPTAMFVGQITRPWVIRPSGAIRLVGIRLLPWGGASLLRTPMSDFTDEEIGTSDLGISWLSDLQDRLALLSPAEWPVEVYEFLRSKGHLGDVGNSSLARRIVAEIRASGGRISVRGLAARLHVSERTVGRTMRHDVGLAPTVLSRILRLQSALGRLLSDPTLELGRIGLQAGYYDHAHFTREFKRLAGCSPSVFLGRDRTLTDSFVDGGGQ